MKLICWILFAFLPLSLFAQQPSPAITPIQRALRNATIVQQGEVINLGEAVRVALAQNYQIKINQAQQQVAVYNGILGNAGLLPVLSGNLNNNNSNQHVRQTYLAGISRPSDDLPGVISRNTTASINLNWTIFNGFASFYIFDQLKEVVRISEVNTRANIEATVANVAASYYDVVRQLQRLLALRQALDISQYRLDLARTNFDVGTFSRVDYLTAQVDYNVDSAAVIAQQLALSNAKILLNTLLVRDPATEFAVRDTIVVRSNLALEPLRESLINNNPLLAAAVLNRRVADLNIKIAQAQQYPTVNLLSGYAYTAINNQAGGTSILATARNNGLTYGIQATVPIFNGFNIRRLKQVATANALIAEYQANNQRLQLDLALSQTFQQYKTNLQLLSLEVENYRITTQNVDIAYDRYRLGSLTAVGFRDVQRNLLDAQLRLIDAEFNAKNAEIELLRLSSTITQELGRG